MYLAWVGEGVRIIPGSRATNECIYKGGDSPWPVLAPVLARVGRRCASRPLRCPARPRWHGRGTTTVLLAKQAVTGGRGLFKGWASVIIPTSLAGVEIAGSVKFMNAVLSFVPRVKCAVIPNGIVIIVCDCVGGVPGLLGGWVSASFQGEFPSRGVCVARRVVQGCGQVFVYLSRLQRLACQVFSFPWLLQNPSSRVFQ